MHKQPAGARHRARNARETRADDLTRENVQSMRRVEETALANRSRADRMAAFIAGFCGSMPFVWLHAAAFAGWIALNTWPGLAHWDPYPFTFLTLVVTAASMPLYLVGGAAVFKLRQRGAMLAFSAVMTCVFSVWAFYGMGQEAFWWSVALGAVSLPVFWLARWRRRAQQAAGNTQPAAAQQ